MCGVRITRPLRINGSNRVIMLEPGTVIQAKRGEFHGSQDSLFLIAGATNVTLRGRDIFHHGGRDFSTKAVLQSVPLLKMWKSDYANHSLYSQAEWRAGIWIGGGGVWQCKGANNSQCGPIDKFPFGACSPTTNIVSQSFIYSFHKQPQSILMYLVEITEFYLRNETGNQRYSCGIFGRGWHLYTKCVRR